MLPDKIIFPAFILLIIVQLFVPAKMIYDSQAVIIKGNQFKFKTAPVDPNDPFRGKYITLSFEEEVVKLANPDSLKSRETAYASLETGQDGFADLVKIARQKPDKNTDFIKVKVNSVYNNNFRLTFPFNRFYMKESKAYEAEQIFRRSQRDTTRTAYAIVMVNEGETVLEDVQINGVSLENIEHFKPDQE